MELILFVMLIIALVVGLVFGYIYGRPSHNISDELLTRIGEKEQEQELLNRTLGEMTEQNHHYLSNMQELSQKNTQLQNMLETEIRNNKKILSQKKSSETRLGQISEHLAPFLSECSYDPKSMHFLGNPIDFMVFDYDQGEIIFLEIKSGNSKESKRQKLIRDVIKAGRVYYERMRIGEKSVRVKREVNNEPPLELGVSDE